jgi:hypothetical protein
MNQLALVKNYLRASQGINNKAVNEALSELFIEEEDHQVITDFCQDEFYKKKLGSSNINRLVRCL